MDHTPLRNAPTKAEIDSELIGRDRTADQHLQGELQALQYGPTEKVLLFTQDPIGLGAQISRRLLGLRLALMFKRKVVFPHIDEPPYAQVFEPVHSDFPYAAHANAPALTPEASQTDPVLFLDFWRLWEAEAFREIATRFSPPEFVERDGADLYTDGFLLNFCQLTQQNRDHVRSAQNRLGVGPRTLGVHLRRGDKKVETPYVPVQAINAAIADWLSTDAFDNVFIATDDPESISEIQLPSNIPLIFDHSEKRYNNANHRFLADNPGLSIQETQTAVKNIYLLGACGAVVGQSNAHFATLAAAQIYYRTGCNRSTLIDGRLALRQSSRLRVAHQIKTGLRQAAKALFPHMTMRSRARSR